MQDIGERLKSYEPLWENWYLDGYIGRGASSRVKADSKEDDAYRTTYADDINQDAYVTTYAEELSVSGGQASILELMKLAEQGDTDAQYQLALCYKTGIGVKKDRKKAKQLFKEARANGSELATIYLKLFSGK